jgi:uncharacterized protein YdaT
MPKKGDTHVVWRGEQKKWAVEVEGQSRASGLHDTKAPAVDQARGIARRNRAELIEHNKNDRVARRDSEGHDPFPPRG